MLELFYSPGACSLVTHIALEEAGEPFQPMRVTLMHGEHLTAEFLEINPRARVPALVTDNGVVTENLAILNLVGDLYGKDGSVPSEPFDAARCNELLGWFSSSVHISFAQVWRGERFTNDEKLFDAIKEGGIRALEKQFAEIEQLSGEGWLVGDSFTAADGYALVFFRWGRRIGMDMGRYPRWAALLQRVLERPAVKRAIEREGLSPAEFQPELAAA